MSRLQFSEYLGCYRDQFAAAERDLVNSVFLEDKMTPELCEEKCGRLGFKYFGCVRPKMTPVPCSFLALSARSLQFGSECWCGNKYGAHGKLVRDSAVTFARGGFDALPVQPDTDCTIKCSGNPDAICGGELKNSVFEVTKGARMSNCATIA